MSAFNQTKIKQFRRCQKQFSFRYDYAEKLGMDPSLEMVPKVKKIGLTKGSWLHELQQAHHRRWALETGFSKRLVQGTADWEEVHETLAEEFSGLFLEEREELGDIPGECERLFRAYLRHWRGDRDLYEVAALDDGRPAIEFIVEYPLQRWGIEDPFKGRIDLLVRDHGYGGLWVWDAKWVKTVPSSDERMMSPQALMYVWALRKLGYDIRGFVYNYGRTKAPTIPRVLQRGTLSLAKRMDTTYETYLRAIKDLHGDRWREYAKHVYIDKLRELKSRDVLWFARERIPVEPERVRQALAEFIVSIRDIERRNTKYPPRTYTYQCKFGCEYHDPCVAEFQGLDIEPLIEAKYTFDQERYGPEDLLKD